MRMSELFGAKTSDFSKFIVCPHVQGGGLSQCGHGGRGKFFTILCGRLLWTAPYNTLNIEQT